MGQRNGLRSAWGQAGPIIRPAIHVLLMAGLYKLNLSQRPTVGELFDEKKLARIDNCFGHHVAQACLFNQIHDCFAFFQARCHRHRAHHMLAGSEPLESTLVHGLEWVC